MNLTYLAMMLNAKAKAPKIMNVSLSPMFGTNSVICFTWSNLVRVRIPVSQNEVPIIFSVNYPWFLDKRNTPVKPVIVKMTTINRMPSTGPENTPRYN